MSEAANQIVGIGWRRPELAEAFLRESPGRHSHLSGWAPALSVCNRGNRWHWRISLEFKSGSRQILAPSMRVCLGLVFLLLSGWTASAQVALGRLPQVSHAGETYISLKEWARSSDFEIYWSKRDRELLVSNRAYKLEFGVDSRRVLVNGLSVWLSLPIYAKDGVPYIGVVDVQTLLHPLIYPPRCSPGCAVKTIVLDPGHGGKDPGNHDPSGNQEKRYTLLLAKEVMAQLTKAGLKAVLTRGSDTYVDRDERPAMATREKADLFVSLHFNSTLGGKSLAKGIETYCLTPVGEGSTNGRGGRRG